MAILDRRFGDLAPRDGLSVQLADAVVPLARDWFIVSRQSVLDRWIGEARPTFSPHTKGVAIGRLVQAFGGKSSFNALVRELLEIDYFDSWVS